MDEASHDDDYEETDFARDSYTHLGLAQGKNSATSLGRFFFSLSNFGH